MRQHRPVRLTTRSGNHDQRSLTTDDSPGPQRYEHHQPHNVGDATWINSVTLPKPPAPTSHEMVHPERDPFSASDRSDQRSVHCGLSKLSLDTWALLIGLPASG